jgi:hypothetical protein
VVPGGERGDREEERRRRRGLPAAGSAAVAVAAGSTMASVGAREAVERGGGRGARWSPAVGRQRERDAGGRESASERVRAGGEGIRSGVRQVCELSCVSVHPLSISIFKKKLLAGQQFLQGGEAHPHDTNGSIRAPRRLSCTIRHRLLPIWHERVGNFILLLRGV